MDSDGMKIPDYQGTAKLFMNGRSQAVRLPAECRFAGKEVHILKEGDTVTLTARPTSWDDFFASNKRPSSDFMVEREDLPVQVREELE